MLDSASLKKLSDPFPDLLLSVKMNSFSKDRTKGMLVLYLQHTDVANRLDSVDPSWSFEAFEPIPEREVVCIKGRLTLCGVVRENVGEGNDLKAAYSDALKRCAMLFGVGRYLYDSELVWVPYNEQTDRYKQWTIEEYRAALARQKGPKKDPVAPSSTLPPITPRPAIKPPVKSMPQAQGYDPEFDSLAESVGL